MPATAPPVAAPPVAAPPVAVPVPEAPVFAGDGDRRPRPRRDLDAVVVVEHERV